MLSRVNQVKSITTIHLIGISFGLTFIWFASYQVGAARFFTLADDVMISMTYARTLALTGEWVWYPGAEFVQGFTNPLWTLILSGLHLLPLDGSGISFVVSLISLFFIFATAVVVSRVLYFISGKESTVRDSIAISLIYFNYPLVYWSLRGFEVSILAFLASLAILLTLKQSASIEKSFWNLFSLGLVICAGLWTRIDFLVVSVAICMPLFFRSFNTSAKRDFRLAMFVILISAFALLAVLTFQSFYWGSWLPNTYYLKATGVDFLERLSRGLLATFKIFPLVLLLAIAARRVMARNLSQHGQLFAWLAVSLFTLTCFYSVYVGGDVWDDYLFANRYVVVCLPIITAFLIYAFFSKEYSGDKGERSLWIFLAISGLGLGVTTNNPPSLARSFLGFFVFSILCLYVLRVQGRLKDIDISGSSLLERIVVVIVLFTTISFSALVSALYFGAPQGAKMDGVMSEAGRELKRVTKEDATISVTWAGSPVYYSERASIDILGKNDEIIAKMEPQQPVPGTWNEKFVPGHNKWDFRWSIETLMPDLVFQFMDHPGERDQLRKLGYNRLCLRTGEEVFIRSDSPNVRREQLKTCP